jgi:hypothetical protein
MGSPKRRNQKTSNLNPSTTTQNKPCKKMGEKLGMAPSLKDAFPITIIAHYMIVMILILLRATKTFYL